MRDLVELALELVGYSWFRRRRSQDGSGRWERMTDQEKLATRRRYLQRSLYVLAIVVLAGVGIAAATLMAWQRHQAASAVALVLGLAAVGAGVTAGVLIEVVARSHPWPVMDPTATLEAHEADGRMEWAANFGVAATVFASLGMALVWIVYGLPAG